MRRFIFAGLAMALAFMLTTGLGGPGVALADGATVINDFECVLLAADSGLGSTLFTNESHSVETLSGNTVLKCKFDIPAGFEPANAIVNEGFLCGTLLGLTTNSKSVASPGGNATLTCQINGSN